MKSMSQNNTVSAKRLMLQVEVFFFLWIEELPCTHFKGGEREKLLADGDVSDGNNTPVRKVVKQNDSAEQQKFSLL